MSDNMMPELTLNPTEAAQEAVPELTLTPEAPTAPEAEKKEVEPVKVDESMLTEQEKKAVDDFAKKIDITDTNLVLNYGVAAQKSVATFSENALSSVRNKDLGEVGETLSNLVVEVKGFGQEEKKGFAGLFHKQKDKLELMRAQYGKAETSVNRIVSELEKHQVTLMKDIAMLDQMYELNLKYYKELTMYIIAGKKRLAVLRAHQLKLVLLLVEKAGKALLLFLLAKALDLDNEVRERLAHLAQVLVAHGGEGVFRERRHALLCGHAIVEHKVRIRDVDLLHKLVNSCSLLLGEHALVDLDGLGLFFLLRLGRGRVRGERQLGDGLLCRCGGV